MFVTARAEYACLAMLELAALYGGDPKPARLADVADKHDIPQRFLVQILLQMKAAGLVATTRGAAGGYRLAKPPDRITLADILGVLDNTEEPTDRKMTPSAMARGLQGVWRRLAEVRSRVLREITLTDLLPTDDEPDYVI